LIRTYQDGDFDTVLTLRNDCHAVDEPGRIISEKELRQRFAAPGIDPTNDLFVALDGGAIVGQSSTRKEVGETFACAWISLDLHPDHRDIALGHRLLDRAETRGRELLESEAQPASFLSPTLETVAYRRTLLEERGYTAARYFWKMILTMDVPTPPSPVNSKVKVRTLNKSSDDIALLTELLNTSFEGHWQMPNITQEQMHHYLNSYEASLYLVAEMDKKLIGNCINVIRDDGSAWVEALGVAKPYRGQGIGRMLLLAGVRALRRAGAGDIFLSVDSQNRSGATRLYDEVGFKRESTSIAYQKHLYPPSSTRTEAAKAR
jgi:mycothiol synthase